MLLQQRLKDVNAHKDMGRLWENSPEDTDTHAVRLEGLDMGTEIWGEIGEGRWLSRKYSENIDAFDMAKERWLDGYLARIWVPT